MRTVVIDPGHGGADPGAIGYGGLREADVTMTISRGVVEYLELMGNQKWRTILTHHGSGLPLVERCDVANDSAASLFVSIHCNAAEAPSAHGFEVFTSVGETAADMVASMLYREISLAFPELRARAGWDDGDIDKEANFFVLRNTHMPAVLIETAFISNFTEEILLGSERWQRKYAATIAQTILKV